MSRTAVLLCSGAEVDPGRVAGAPTVVVEELCSRPEAAARALQALDADRAVLGLCSGRPSSDLVHALRRAGVSPFGIQTVALGGLGRDEAARLLTSAFARLEALASDERGRPVLSTGRLSRRALFAVSPVLNEAPVAVVDPAACVGSLRCGLCAEACPEGAFDVSGPVPAVDSQACDACGVCVPRCPHGALRLAGSSTAQVEAQLEVLLPGTPGVLFACRAAAAETPPGWALVELPTLALVSPGWILQVRSRGVEVRLAPCAEPHCAASRQVEALARRIVAEAGEPARSPGGRLRLAEPLATVTALAGLAGPGAAAVIDDEASPLGLLEIAAERCTLCGACSAACPANALQLASGVVETVLRHEPGACVACGRCVAACRESALGVRREIDVARVGGGTLELVRAEVEACAGCGGELPPRPMRERLRELLPRLAGAPLDLCAACAAQRPYDRVPVPGQGEG